MYYGVIELKPISLLLRDICPTSKRIQPNKQITILDENFNGQYAYVQLDNSINPHIRISLSYSRESLIYESIN
jgi:hypothetical protein